MWTNSREETLEPSDISVTGRIIFENSVSNLTLNNHECNFHLRKRFICFILTSLSWLQA